ncbi:hypothetical protein GCM10009764_77820 [Nocardia ninae]|uniref:Uncharacterized protein n=1 Tax=Nocardia ninae NBRC 108245 TaxID=1210091 RepID=A0A511MEF9_9NOCA|nr:hypothetical protein NN4_30460 [Nocardia ninae NBRC 108245]
MSAIGQRWASLKLELGVLDPDHLRLAIDAYVAAPAVAAPTALCRAHRASAVEPSTCSHSSVYKFLCRIDIINFNYDYSISSIRTSERTAVVRTPALSPPRLK